MLLPVLFCRPINCCFDIFEVHHYVPIPSPKQNKKREASLFQFLQRRTDFLQSIQASTETTLITLNILKSPTSKHPPYATIQSLSVLKKRKEEKITP